MVADRRVLVQDQDDPADRGRPNKGGPRSSHSRGMGENYTRGCPRLVRALWLQGSQLTDGLGRGRMNAVSLRTESFTAVEQPNSLFKSQTAVTTLLDEAKCYEVIRQLRWPDGVVCLHCRDRGVVRNGHDDRERNRQRYLCKTCKYRFDDLTEPFWPDIINRSRPGSWARTSWE